MSDRAKIDKKLEENSISGGKSAIAFLAAHPTAANLIMAIMIIFGIWGLIKMNSQFLPKFGIDVVSVIVEWPGANAEDVDNNIVQLIEPGVRFLDGVKRVRSTSYDGVARVSVEFQAGSDMQAALGEVEAAVVRLTTLPEDSKKPEIQRVIRYDTIARIVLSGSSSEASLKIFGKKMRDELLARGIDKVTLFGSRNEEVLVEVEQRNLKRLDLSLEEIAGRISSTSVDLPSGNIGDGSRQIRSMGLLKSALDIGSVEVRSLNYGGKINLSDIAYVREAFDKDAATAQRRGLSAIELHLRRALDSDALELADTVRKYIKEIDGDLPKNIQLEYYDFATDLLEERINLLVKNGLSGLVLVGLILFIFLNFSVALWVLIGIPISFLAALGVMFATDQTINMISLFGLIMALGIVVDDAIVVGEHSEYLRRQGLEPLEAAVSGAKRMAAPVVCASLTTICAFLPLILVTGIIGQIIAAIPLVIVAILIASLIECFYVLPGHLYHSMSKFGSTVNQYERFRKNFDLRFQKFRNQQFFNMVKISIRWRYLTLALTITLLILALGLLVGGRVNFNFFPTPEADKIFANVKMVAGSSRKQTVGMLMELERAALSAAEKKLGKDNNLIRMISVKVGVPASGGSRGATPSNATDNSTGGLILEMLTADKRKIRAPEFIRLWRQEINLISGLKTLTIQQARGGPPGRDIDIQIKGKEVNILKRASADIIKLLSRYPGVSDVEDNIPYGKTETILSVTNWGRSLGLTTKDIGRQVRNAIEGAIAKKFPRGDEEVIVRVRYPLKNMKTSALDRIYIKTPLGKDVSLTEVVSINEKIGFSQVKRENGKRQISITAEVNTQLTSTAKVISALKRDGVEKIIDKYGLELDFAGKAEERSETFADMRLGFIIGMCGIYIILAWVFASYSRPIAIMSMIPLGFIGTVFGHWLLGYNLTILSLIGLIGLSGIVINGSIILVTTFEERLKTKTFENALIEASCDRLRPIILTSATTIVGLLPLIFEKSLQAQFLIPMAITIIFGLGVSTLLVLFVVPSLLIVIRDLGLMAKKIQERLVFLN